MTPLLTQFKDNAVLNLGKHVEGQIYIPAVNWLLGALTMACLLIFRSNTAIGNGYGDHLSQQTTCDHASAPHHSVHLCTHPRCMLQHGLLMIVSNNIIWLASSF